MSAPLTVRFPTAVQEEEEGEPNAAAAARPGRRVNHVALQRRERKAKGQRFFQFTNFAPPIDSSIPRINHNSPRTTKSTTNTHVYGPKTRMKQKANHPTAKQSNDPKQIATLTSFL